MKVFSFLAAAAACALAVAVAGCNSNGSLTPGAQATLQADLDNYCPIATALAPEVATLPASAQTAYSVVLSICPPNPAPTNATVAAIDLFNAYQALKPYLASK